MNYCVDKIIFIKIEDMDQILINLIIYRLKKIL